MGKRQQDHPLLSGDETIVPSASSRRIAFRKPSLKEVIVVDDDYDQMENLAELLTYSGWITHGYTSPLDAMSFLETHVCHALLSDVHMPSMGGPQLAQWVTNRHPAMHVILMSGFQLDPSELQDGWLFFLKPINFPLLLKTIEGC